MKRLKIVTIIVVALMFALGNVLWAEGESNVNWPSLDKLNADKKTLEEISVFYEKMTAALNNEEIESMMSIYADDYLQHGITNRELRFMWQEIFKNYDSLYASHILTKVDQSGSGRDVILKSTGGLFGISHGSTTGDFETVDSWAMVNHWMYKISGEWKLVGGAAHKKMGVLGEEFHPQL